MAARIHRDKTWWCKIHNSNSNSNSFSNSSIRSLRTTCRPTIIQTNSSASVEMGTRLITVRVWARPRVTHSSICPNNILTMETPHSTTTSRQWWVEGQCHLDSRWWDRCNRCQRWTITSRIRALACTVRMKRRTMSSHWCNLSSKGRSRRWITLRRRWTWAMAMVLRCSLSRRTTAPGWVACLRRPNRVITACKCKTRTASPWISSRRPSNTPDRCHSTRKGAARWTTVTSQWCYPSNPSTTSRSRHGQFHRWASAAGPPTSRCITTSSKAASSLNNNSTCNSNQVLATRTWTSMWAAGSPSSRTGSTRTVS